MIKKLTYTILALLGFIPLRAQVNLVPDPSFEFYYKSGNSGYQVSGVADSNKYNCLYNWFNINGSVDLYCNHNTSFIVNGCMGGGERWAIPPTIFGEVYPLADYSFIGLGTWTTSLNNAFTPYAYSSREWAGVKLVSPLKKDQCYIFTMYVARAAKTGYNVRSLFYC